MAPLDQVLDGIVAWPQLTSTQRGDLIRHLQALSRLARDDASRLLARFVQLLERASAEGRPPVAVGELAGALGEAILAARWRKLGEPGASLLASPDIQSIRQAYRLLDDDRARAHLLRLLAADATREALTALADLLVEHPPGDLTHAAFALSPLLQQANFDPAPLFPRLLDALSRPHLAALILDIANFVTRKGLVAAHPAAPRTAELAELLGQLAKRLGQIEERPDQASLDPQALRQAVDESIALCISLCDALALIGNPSTVGKLNQALTIGHRRVQTEAAAALARLGQQSGLDHLVRLAGDPASRTRALAYLDELGALERARPEDRTAAARAAAQLADWLGEPAQFGAPPHRVELIDTRRLYWPGYDEPVDCRLFAYEYRLRDGTLGGVGIVGPVTYSLAADLEDLPPDDIYAAFAGWQAEHEELQETPAADLPDWKRKNLMLRLAPLEAEGYHDLKLLQVGHFFGEEILIASARRGDALGTVVLDADQVSWYPAGATRRPIGPTEAYYIHKGRKLLKAFNPEGGEIVDEMHLRREQ
jgi:hypothetical protein